MLWIFNDWLLGVFLHLYLVFNTPAVNEREISYQWQFPMLIFPLLKTNHIDSVQLHFAWFLLNKKSSLILLAIYTSIAFRKTSKPEESYATNKNWITLNHSQTQYSKTKLSSYLINLSKKIYFFTIFTIILSSQYDSILILPYKKTKNINYKELVMIIFFLEYVLI